MRAKSKGKEVEVRTKKSFVDVKIMIGHKKWDGVEKKDEGERDRDRQREREDRNEEKRIKSILLVVPCCSTREDARGWCETIKEKGREKEIDKEERKNL